MWVVIKDNFNTGIKKAIGPFWSKSQAGAYAPMGTDQDEYTSDILLVSSEGLAPGWPPPDGSEPVIAIRQAQFEELKRLVKRAHFPRVTYREDQLKMAHQAMAEVDAQLDGILQFLDLIFTEKE